MTKVFSLIFEKGYPQLSEPVVRKIHSEIIWILSGKLSPLLDMEHHKRVSQGHSLRAIEITFCAEGIKFSTEGKHVEVHPLDTLDSMSLIGALDKYQKKICEEQATT